ncbi:MAG TPA: multifunctional CCA tRNA nucleotidyl transferase/2'3'-cyclic phosphodiesterase/2'nucleotidase/phosphatase [Burkholderiales bacterium]|nr:multifunctional CCA tRNA nucleotidyl transferase/2'3'-cyclic phosphodiesterase/2'nucleotidase/phosphatase [Burkholderiales bacterium]
MKIYQVGGAVRDELLGLPVKDRDYVVVGATPEEMVRLGFRPVGKDFPVFLHPVTQEEHALARTERKTGPGYKGFTIHAAPDVTLEDDLARRDLTINALAKDEQGNVIDPFGGVADLRAGVLRHVSPAFAEDPVRVLRVARFAARFGFDVAPETMALMRAMAASGEVDALVPERLWQELAKGLMEPSPRRMFELLAECGALARVLPEWSALDGPRALGALDVAAARQGSLAVRYAALFAGGTEDVAERASVRVRAPGDCHDLAVLAGRMRAAIESGATLDAAAVVDLLQRVDAFRRPERFESLLVVCECDAAAAGRLDPTGPERLRRAADAARAIDAGAVARAHPGEVAQAIRAGRIDAVSRVPERSA